MIARPQADQFWKCSSHSNKLTRLRSLSDVEEYLLDGLIHEELEEVLCRNNADLISPFLIQKPSGTLDSSPQAGLGSE